MLRKGVLIVTIISAVVSGALLLFYFLYWPKVQQRNTALVAHIVEEAAETYHKDYAAYPDGSNAEIIAMLLGKNSRSKSYLRPEFRSFLDASGNASDSWKQPFRIDVQTEGKFRLRSAGPNGTFDDEDDLTSADALE